MSRWGDEKTVYFITCYRQYDCLWDPKSPLYKIKEARENAYSSLLEQFNDENLTIKLMKTKIKNLRTTYHQELNKIRASEESGSSPVYKPTVCWFKNIDAFLRNTVQPTTLSATKLLQTSTNSVKRKLLSSSHLNLELGQRTKNDQQPIAKKQKRSLSNKLKKRRQYEENVSEIFDTNIYKVDNTSTMTNTPSVCEDEFHFFGMNVAAQLRSLPLHVALQLQTEFQNKLFLARVPLGSDMVDNTIQNNEELSDSGTAEHDVDVKVSPHDMQHTIQVPFDSLSYENAVKVTVFKKAWDQS